MRSLTIIIIAIFIVSGADAQRKSLVGKIEKYKQSITGKNDSLRISNRFGDDVLHAEIKEDGSFKGILNVVNEGEHFVILNKGVEFYLYLSKRSDLSISWQDNKAYETLNFNGKGARESTLFSKLILELNSLWDSCKNYDEKNWNKQLEVKKKYYTTELRKLKLSKYSSEIFSNEIVYKIEDLQFRFDNYLQEKKLTGNQSPSFEFENYNGGKTRLEDFRGKYVFIDIWATYCYSCIKSFPDAKKIKERYRDKNFEFVYISIDDQKSYNKWKDDVVKYNLSGYQLIKDNEKDSEFISEFKIQYAPRYILLDPDGRVLNFNLPYDLGDKKLMEYLDKTIK